MINLCCTPCISLLNIIYSMANFQPWPISQTANKAQGTCSVCFLPHQLHIKDNTVHLHGSRAARCPGSNKPPAVFLGNPGPAPVLFSSQPTSTAAAQFLSTRRSSLSTMIIYTVARSCHSSSQCCTCASNYPQFTKWRHRHHGHFFIYICLKRQ